MISRVSTVRVEATKAPAKVRLHSYLLGTPAYDMMVAEQRTTGCGWVDCTCSTHTGPYGGRCILCISSVAQNTYLIALLCCTVCRQQVQAVPRRQALAAGASLTAALLGAAAAQAAGESSATRAITAVTRPQQLQKK